jgi:hypothetical protein
MPFALRPPFRPRPDFSSRAPAAGESGHAPLKRGQNDPATHFYRAPDWRSGEPRSGAGDEARQVCGFYRVLATAHCRLRRPRIGALRKSIGGAEAAKESKPAKKPRKVASGQKEMLMPIAGRKPAKEAAAKKPAAKPQRKSA